MLLTHIASGRSHVRPRRPTGIANDEAKQVARRLLSENGPPEAWQHSTREAIDAHLRDDADGAAHWSAVQRELKAVAPRPGAGDLDIYRLASMLIAQHGTHVAWSHAMQQGVEAGSDLSKQAHWLRVADAVTARAKGDSEEGA